MGSLIAVVTLYYLSSPFIIKPHPRVTENITQVTSTRPPSSSFSLWTDESLVIENWTKWRLYLRHEGGGERSVVYPQSFLSLSQEDLPVSACLEWRSDYTTEISVENQEVSVRDHHPYLSLGIYNHYQAAITDNGKTIKFLPNFLFGIPHSLLQTLYPGAEDLPIRGLFLGGVAGDRMIVQFVMVCVACAVLWRLAFSNE